ncbi:hypothetical protein MSPP1_001351 [Malassezia sp. CBS 17886]|nr:hypothetical protein MSPP1_001351 [Malassezia sp. CBS 17886]
MGGHGAARTERGACALAELVQFHCQLQEHRILCQPVERVFRMCPQRPAVEVTNVVEYHQDGSPFLPEYLAGVPLPTGSWPAVRKTDSQDA